MKGPLFTEVIRVQDGEFCRPEPHAARMAATMEHFFGSGAGACLPAEVPEGMREGLVKCRVVYDESVRRGEFAPYRLRRIASVALVRADGLDYRYKYADRSTLEELRRGSGCDEVVLLQEGFLTDSSFSNIVLGDASGLYTPDWPLLAGTRRAELLRTGRVTARPIRAEELEHYAYLWFVNAMVGLEDDLCFSVKNIRI